MFIYQRVNIVIFHTQTTRSQWCLGLEAAAKGLRQAPGAGRVEGVRIFPHWHLNRQKTLLNVLRILL